MKAPASLLLIVGFSLFTRALPRRRVHTASSDVHATYSKVYDRSVNRWQQNGADSMRLSFTGNR